MPLKRILKQKFCASSWLITEINMLRRTVNKTSKDEINVAIFVTETQEDGPCIVALHMSLPAT